VSQWVRPVEVSASLSEECEAEPSVVTLQRLAQEGAASANELNLAALSRVKGAVRSDRWHPLPEALPGTWPAYHS
jgi:hypothetical protein